MKRLSLLFLLFIAIGCQNDDSINLKKGLIQFSFSGNPGGKVGKTAEPAAILMSLEDADGNVIEQDKKLPLYAFGSGYVSEGLQLPTGNYKLTKFMVLDTDNAVIYATPVEGSDLAHLVDDPLPIAFAVTENGTTLVTPQVLPITTDTTPESFGYVGFGFEVVTQAPKLMEIWQDEPSDIHYKTFLTYSGDKPVKQTTYYYYLTSWQLLDSTVFHYNSTGKVSEKISYYVFGRQPGEQPYPAIATFEYYTDGNLKNIITMGNTGTNDHQFDFYYDNMGKPTHADQRFYPSLSMRHQIKYEVNADGEVIGTKVFNALGTTLMFEFKYTFDGSLSPTPFFYEHDAFKLSQKHNLATQQTIGYNLTPGGLIESYSCQFSMVYETTNNRVTKATTSNPDYCFETNTDQTQYTYIYE